MYHGDGENDTFLSLLIMLKPIAESLDSCLIPAPFAKRKRESCPYPVWGEMKSCRFIPRSMTW